MQVLVVPFDTGNYRLSSDFIMSRGISGQRQYDVKMQKNMSNLSRAKYELKKAEEAKELSSRDSYDSGRHFNPRFGVYFSDSGTHQDFL